MKVVNFFYNFSLYLNFINPLILLCRLQGITKSISRYPTFRRRFEDFIKTIPDDLAKKKSESKSNNDPKTIPRSKSTFARMFSQRSFSNKTSNHGSSDQESRHVVIRDVEIL